jgi:hypothetical protein
MYTNISQWLVEWYKLSDRIFPLDKWELEYVRDGIWDEWMQINEHIEKEEEILIKEREILDTLLLTTIEWAEKKARRFSEKEAIKFITTVKSKNQTEQHTQQWHAEKSRLLTASEFAYILGGAESAVRKNVFIRKFEKKTDSGVFIGEVSSPTGDSTPVGVSNENLSLPATVWGHRFEPVARLLASKMFFEGAEILDNVGRIVHETHKNLAASPDGLITEGKFKGHLIEIKCPITRIPVEDEIPHDYYCQMQIQMEVLNCPIVEFVEMKFKQYKDLPEETTGWCGVLAVILNGSTLRYEYGPFDSAYSSNLTRWTPTLQEEDELIEKTYWILENSHWKTVHRNTFWWSEIGFPAYEKFWSEFDPRYEEWTSKKSNWLFSED